MRDVVENADGEFHAFDEFLDEDVVSVLRGIRHRGLGLGLDP